MKSSALPVLLFAGLFAVTAQVPGPKPRRPPMLLNRLEPVFHGQTLSGQNVGPGYFQGRVTLLNFMCLGCVPMLHRLQAQVTNPAFQLLAIAPHTAGQLRHFNSADASPQAAFWQCFKVAPIRYEMVPECSVVHNSGNTFGPECSTISD